MTAISPDLKNQQEVTQNVLEANLIGDLVEMPAGPLAYALGMSYRENSFNFMPDNLSQNQNFVDPIAGLFPNENSGGEFDVAEIYGELLIPIISDGPTGVEHFNIELGGRISDWSMPDVDTLETYKALIDWGITDEDPNARRLQPRVPRAELGRAVHRAHADVRRPTLDVRRPVLASSMRPDRSARTPLSRVAAQAAQTQAICRALMGRSARSRTTPAAQPTVGRHRHPEQLGNPNLSEEQADTLTIGVVMDILENWTLTVDYYTIEIEDMIAIEGPDSVYERCLSLAQNPTGEYHRAGVRADLQGSDQRQPREHRPDVHERRAERRSRASTCRSTGRRCWRAAAST